MNKKPINYILIFLLLFIVLIGLQVYFLFNSYSLKEREVIETIRSKLKGLEDDKDIFDVAYFSHNDDYLEIFVALDEQKINEDSVRTFYRKRSDIISKKLNKYVDSLFQDLGYEISVKKTLNSVYSTNSKKELLKDKITIYASDTVEGKNNYLSSGIWEMTYSKSSTEIEKIQEKNTDDLKIISYGYLVSRESTFIIGNIYWILFNELLLFIVASILILIAILYIFYLTYKNLLKQNKHVLVLHDMVDNVSHEMRTPIATLKLASKNLQNSHQGVDFTIFDRQINRLEKLLAPLTSTEADYDRNEYSLKDLNLLLSDLQGETQFNKVEVKAFPENSIQVNKVQFETIISNLIVNSIKYGAKQVYLSVELLDEILQIIVRDNGIGIDENELPYIFEKFYRVQKDNIQQSRGLGLGLYIIKALVDKVKGEIQVNSQINKGSEFKITIPYGE